MPKQEPFRAIRQNWLLTMLAKDKVTINPETLTLNHKFLAYNAKVYIEQDFERSDLFCVIRAFSVTWNLPSGSIQPASTLLTGLLRSKAVRSLKGG